jgi:hypothetical protein
LEGHQEHENDFIADVENPELLSDEEAEAICDAGPTDTTDTTGTTDDGGANGGDLNSPEDVIDDTTSKKPLPNTGGVPLYVLLASGLFFGCVGLYLIRSTIRGST